MREEIWGGGGLDKVIEQVLKLDEEDFDIQWTDVKQVFSKVNILKAEYLADVCPQQNTANYTAGQIIRLILKMIFGLKICLKTCQNEGLWSVSHLMWFMIAKLSTLPPVKYPLMA